MTPAKILTLCAVCLPLTACDGWKGGGEVRSDPPQAVFAQPCARPEQFLSAGDWELIAGRIGDELIDCEAKRAGLGLWANGVSQALGGE